MSRITISSSPDSFNGYNETKIDVPWKASSNNEKEGNDRLRWNLLFNVLLWTIIPLPLWLPFVSMHIAINLLPLLQILFMICWVTVNASSWVSYFKLFITRKKKFAPRSDLEHLITIST